MRPEQSKYAAPSLKAWVTNNGPTVVYPWRPEDQQEEAHILWGELLNYLVIRKRITLQQFLNHKDLLCKLGL